MPPCFIVLKKAYVKHKLGMEFMAVPAGRRIKLQAVINDGLKNKFMTDIGLQDAY
jgi:hypothetical protein